MQVYAWFMIVFRLSVGVGFAGYVLLLLEFTGVGLLLRPLLGPAAAVTGVRLRLGGGAGWPALQGHGRQLQWRAGLTPACSHVSPPPLITLHPFRPCPAPAIPGCSDLVWPVLWHPDAGLR